MLLSHVAEAEEMLSTPYVVLAPELPVHAELPLEPGKTQSSLAQKARCLRHADQFVRRGDVLDVNMRATLKSGGVFLRIATGKGWVAEQSVLGEKALEPADVTPCNGIFRVLTDVLRVRKLASRTDVKLSTRLTKLMAPRVYTLTMRYGDVFEAAGQVDVRGERYLRLKDGRGYVLQMDSGMPLVLELQPQVGSWMYKVIFEGGIGVRHVASDDNAHRVADAGDAKHPLNVPRGVAVEVDMRVFRRTGLDGPLVAFLRLRDGSGWIFEQKGGHMLAELIAWNYEGPTGEELSAQQAEKEAQAVGNGVVPSDKPSAADLAADAEASTEMAEEESLGEFVLEDVDDIAAPAPAYVARPSPERAPLGERNVALGTDGANDSPADMRVAKIASANQHAAAQYSAASESDEVAVVEALTSLNRLWASTRSA